MKRYIQIVEILCAPIIVLGGINFFYPLNILSLDTEAIANLAAGAILVYVFALCLKKRGKGFSKSTTTVLIAGSFFGFSTNLQAQDVDYQKQVDAMQKSFAQKSIDPIKPHISPELKFYTYSAGATQQILGQVFANLPPLNSVEITKSQKGEAHVYYNFTGLGERNSKILFDELGKITKIELIDNLLDEQAKAQAALAKQVQAPSPGELGEKFHPEKVEFPSKDGLMITGNLYEVDSSAPTILLCHSGGGNKYEYADIAPKLNAKGFNTLTIDQRSGGAFAGQPNETFARAQSSGFGTEFTDAQPDIEAAINYLAEKYDKKVTLWGSSYSAALALFIAQNNENINGMILFSPGDYLSGQKGTLNGKLGSIDVPFLMTSTREEAKAITNILLDGVVLSDTQTQHVPSFEGYHGSRALWDGQKGAEEYWKQVWETLAVIYPEK